MEENNTEYKEKGKTYANTFYTMAIKMEKKGMLKMMIGLDKVPNKIDTSDFNNFLDKAKMNAHNLCVRDLNEQSSTNPEKKLEVFLNGFEEEMFKLLN